MQKLYQCNCGFLWHFSPPQANEYEIISNQAEQDQYIKTKQWHCSAPLYHLFYYSATQKC